MNKRITIKIYGDVQGVFFRSSTKETAEKLNLSGWARNESDGTLSIVAEGEKENLEKFLDWCRRGPGIARVDKIDVLRGEAGDRFSGFEIL